MRSKSAAEARTLRRRGLPSLSALTGYAAASAVGASFWCWSDRPGYVWGVRDREFVPIRVNRDRDGHWYAFDVSAENPERVYFQPLQVAP